MIQLRNDVAIMTIDHKRIFDLVAACIGLLFVWPLFLLTAMGVWIFLGSPLLFRQQRSGLQGRLFTIYKFRTMRDLTDDQGKWLTDRERLTPFGVWLRSTSLDELPQLWNVIKGDMSLVGPRALLLQDILAVHRLAIRPGITGWAQINGRNAISPNQRLKLDLWYIENRSFWLDIKILLVTIKLVLLRKDIDRKASSKSED